ncbi:hypothetical protein RvY_08777 [Ramazzottius varieornatus]|uniref:Uncharacterized protein n=1 Tax=Ramazzottius varieornatus TaxID=947166 RepID=A0A1D1V762_RAMVA|nr:hypothetical protein RvY_08777 [Ramazzottius varieornatus]
MASGNVSSTLDLQGQLNASDNNGKRFYYYETEQLTFMFILAFLVISFNLMVLVGLGISKSRTRMGFWVLHLALAGTTEVPLIFHVVAFWMSMNPAHSPSSRKAFRRVFSKIFD